MTPVDAWRDGARRVSRAPALLAGVWLATLVVSVPLALVLRGMLADHLGSSMAADAAAAGVNYDWMQEFGEQATGIGVTFRSTIIGFGAVLDNASAFVDAEHRPLVVAAAAAAYLFAWLFLAGGILDRYARDRATRGSGFFAACGVFFFRFLRLAVVQWAAYALTFGAVHQLLFGRLYPRLTHDLTVERRAFAIRVVLYVVFLVLVGAVNLVFDYAKVRAVVEDRRSMLGALAAAVRFLARNTPAIGLYLVNVLTFVLCVGAYLVVAPGAGGGWMIWAAPVVGQIYVVARLWVKLTFWASETAFFQSRLAHASYVAAPEAVWPDSPSVEAIRRA